MIKLVFITLAVAVVTAGLVWLINKFIPSKAKKFITLALWAVIICLGYLTFNSVYGEIKFNQLKQDRYKESIAKLVDIRDSQLAHREVTGTFAKDYASLVNFIENGKFTIVEKRDTSVVDAELTRRYGGVTSFKDEVIIDTLGTVSIKDSLFKNSTRYKDMMKVPFAQDGVKFDMKAGYLVEEGDSIPVFEAFIKKAKILHDQNKDFIMKENQIVSVEEVNGDAIRVGSMTEAKTIGNWPKTYGDNE